MEEFQKTERGFKIYGSLRDTKESTVRVQESSTAGEICAWIFTEAGYPHYENPSPHLSVENASELILLLKKFITDAEDPENWRNKAPH